MSLTYVMQLLGGIVG